MKSRKLATAAIALAAGIAMGGAALAQNAAGSGGSGMSQSGVPSADGGNRAGAPSGDTMMGKPDKGLKSTGGMNPVPDQTGTIPNDSVGGRQHGGGDSTMQ